MPIRRGSGGGATNPGWGWVDCQKTTESQTGALFAVAAAAAIAFPCVVWCTRNRVISRTIYIHIFSGDALMWCADVMLHVRVYLAPRLRPAQTAAVAAAAYLAKMTGLWLVPQAINFAANRLPSWTLGSFIWRTASSRQRNTQRRTQFFGPVKRVREGELKSTVTKNWTTPQPQSFGGFNKHTRKKKPCMVGICFGLYNDESQIVYFRPLWIRKKTKIQNNSQYLNVDRLRHQTIIIPISEIIFTLALEHRSITAFGSFIRTV